MVMNKNDLMSNVGKKVIIYFKGIDFPIIGILGFVDEFSSKYDYRKPNYFFINNTSFKPSHVAKLIIL